MSANFQYKIRNFEIDPPPEVWNKIAGQLDEEFRPEDIKLSQRLYDLEVNPPSFILQNILSAITEEKKIEQPPRIVTFPVKRLAAAAVIVGLISIALFYLIRSDSPGSAQQNDTAEIIPAPSDSKAPARVPITPGEDPMKRSAVPLLVQEKRNDKRMPVRSGKSANSTKYAGLDHIRSSHSTTPILVAAPPIRDGNGNIIMDVTLVSAPNDNYIIVTSPNGQQTKISRKFLYMLSFMNGGTTNGYLNTEGSQWKSRFDEWKIKLLQHASYIPTATNFLDIMDLKEMIQEN